MISYNNKQIKIKKIRISKQNEIKNKLGISKRTSKVEGPLLSILFLSFELLLRKCAEMSLLINRKEFFETLPIDCPKFSQPQFIQKSGKASNVKTFS